MYWKSEGDIAEREVDEYPCANIANNVHEVVIPILSKSMDEAITNCKILGGTISFPSKGEEVSKFVDLVKSKMEDAKCGEYVWANIIRNYKDGNNWTIYEHYTSYKPPFEYPGWLKFAEGQPNGGEYEVCAGINLDPDEQNVLHDLECSAEGYCYVCRLDNQ